MKVAIITSGLFRYTGGPPIVISNLINQLSKFDDLELTYFGVDGEIHPKMKVLDKSVIVKNFKVKTAYRFSYLFLKEIIKTNPDVVWVHGLWLWPNFAGIMYALFTRKKLIVTAHGVLTKQMFSRKWYKKISIGLLEILVLILKKNVSIHYLSNAEREACVLKKMNIKNKIIPNYVNSKPNVTVKRNKEFLFLARIAPIKGIEDILSIKNLDCDIYGFGEEEYIKKTVLNHPKYLGELESKDVDKVYSKYKFYLLPSYGEGLPTSAIEAVMCGCVLVVSNECNLNMFTNGKDAIKFDAGLDNLKKAINEVNKLNEEELYIIKENAINVLESEFSTKVLNNKYKQFIK